MPDIHRLTEALRTLNTIRFAASETAWPYLSNSERENWMESLRSRVPAIQLLAFCSFL